MSAIRIDSIHTLDNTPARRNDVHHRHARKSARQRSATRKSRSRSQAHERVLKSLADPLADEDAGNLATRKRDGTTLNEPRRPIEQSLASQIDADDTRADCVRSTAVALAAQRVRNDLIERNQKETDTALELGEMLFWKPAWPIPRAAGDLAVVLDSPPDADRRLHPDQPARVLLRLEQSRPGCDWLLAQWQGMRRRLVDESVWRSIDAFRMIRLMGKHAMHMADDFDVARALLCSFVLIDKPPMRVSSIQASWPSKLFHMLLAYDLDPYRPVYTKLSGECDPFFRRLGEMPLARLAPSDKDEARQWLSTQIDRELARLRPVRARLQEIAEADAAETAARLALETSPEGERLRQSELSSERLANATIGEILKTRKPARSGLFDPVDADKTVKSAAAPNEPDCWRPAVTEDGHFKSSLGATWRPVRHGVRLDAGVIDTAADYRVAPPHGYRRDYRPLVTRNSIPLLVKVGWANEFGARPDDVFATRFLATRSDDHDFPGSTEREHPHGALLYAASWSGFDRAFCLESRLAMVQIKLPDGSVKDYPEGVSPREVAAGIGKRLADAAVAAVAQWPDRRRRSSTRKRR